MYFLQNSQNSDYQDETTSFFARKQPTISRCEPAQTTPKKIEIFKFSDLPQNNAKNRPHIQPCHNLPHDKGPKYPPQTTH